MIKKSVETVFVEIRETLANGGTVIFSTVVKAWDISGNKRTGEVRLTSQGTIEFKAGQKWFPAGSGKVIDGADYFTPLVDIRIFHRPTPAQLASVSK